MGIDTRAVLATAALRRATAAAAVVIEETGRAARLAGEPGPGGPVNIVELADAIRATDAGRALLLQAIHVNIADPAGAL